MAPSRIEARLLAALAGIALAFCVAGVDGLVANSVVERARALRPHGARRDAGADGNNAAAAGVGLTLCGTAIGPCCRCSSRPHAPDGVRLTVNDPLMLLAAAESCAAACAAAIVPAWRRSG